LDLQTTDREGIVEKGTLKKRAGDPAERVKFEGGGGRTKRQGRTGQKFRKKNK